MAQYHLDCSRTGCTGSPRLSFECKYCDPWDIRIALESECRHSNICEGPTKNSGFFEGSWTPSSWPIRQGHSFQHSEFVPWFKSSASRWISFTFWRRAGRLLPLPLYVCRQCATTGSFSLFFRGRDHKRQAYFSPWICILKAILLRRFCFLSSWIAGYPISFRCGLWRMSQSPRRYEAFDESLQLKFLTRWL